MTIETLNTNNFISPRPTFWKILASIDFLEQVVAILGLSTWWKHSVKNSQCQNDVLLNELVGKWKEWILQKNKPQLYHYQQSLSILERTQASFKNSDINHSFSTERKNTCYPTSPKSPASVTANSEKGTALGNIHQQNPTEGKVLTDDSPWTYLILIRRREEQNISIG